MVSSEISFRYYDAHGVGADDYFFDAVGIECVKILAHYFLRSALRSGCRHCGDKYSGRTYEFYQFFAHSHASDIECHTECDGKEIDFEISLLGLAVGDINLVAD